MNKPTILLVAVTMVTLHALPQSTKEEIKVNIQAKEQQAPSKEAAERKERSCQQLVKEGVPTIAHLPVIEDSSEAKVRTVEEIAQRAVAICIAAVKGEGLEQKEVDSLVAKYGAQKFFSPEEAAFIKELAPTEADRIKFSWRYECLWVCLWSLGYVEKLERPEDVCDVGKAVAFLFKRDSEQFVKDARLRPIQEILDQSDLIYRYHWAVVSARLKSQEAPAGLEGGVVQERHYILNWLVGYMNQEWDDISTDT